MSMGRVFRVIQEQLRMAERIIVEQVIFFPQFFPPVVFWFVALMSCVSVEETLCAIFWSGPGLAIWPGLKSCASSVASSSLKKKTGKRKQEETCSFRTSRPKWCGGHEFWRGWGCNRGSTAAPCCWRKSTKVVDTIRSERLCYTRNLVSCFAHL
jgi:hypothetical protein